MAIESVDTLLADLRRLELLAPEQVDQVERELAPHFADPRALGEYLVQIDWLTAYQLGLLLAGRPEELTVGPYHVLDRVGEGGLSEVFKAWDTQRGRVVALKVLHAHLLDQSRAVRVMEREFQAVTRLSHPNVIRTYDARRLGPLHYFAMEFVGGMDLRQFVRQAGPLPVGLACDLARQVAQGLQHAHQVGLVHRDIKPANLFLINPPLPGPAAPPAPGAGGAAQRAAPAHGTARRPDPVVKIIDWGLARCVGPPGEGQAGGEPPTVQDRLDEEERGELIGTADYIAPEQARDPTLVDTRADVYSLGCTLYFLLTGEPPYPGASVLEKVRRHQEADPPSVRAARPDAPEELDQVIGRMMAKRPGQRYQIPLFVVGALRRFCAAGGPAAGPPRPGSAPRLARPGSSTHLPRSSTPAEPSRPGSSLGLSRPGNSGTAGREPPR